MRSDATMSSRLVFSSFDERFLEKSWQWLRDPELKRLTMTPDFTRDDQRRWFERLPQMADYRIWGISCDGRPVGALGLKHITAEDAEYWGYLGERTFWNRGLGGEMMQFAFARARELGLRGLHLKVQRDNERAIRLYTHFGFALSNESEGVLHLRTKLNAGDLQ